MWYSVGCSRFLTTTTKYVIYLFRVRVGCCCVSYAVADIWMMIYFIFAVSVFVFVPGMVCYCLSVDISYNCFIVFIQSFMFRYAHSGYNVIIYGYYLYSTLLLCTHIVADFLLVYIYTLRNELRDRELRVCVSGKAADLAHFCA